MFRLYIVGLWLPPKYIKLWPTCSKNFDKLPFSKVDQEGIHQVPSWMSGGAGHRRRPWGRSVATPSAPGLGSCLYSTVYIYIYLCIYISLSHPLSLSLARSLSHSLFLTLSFSLSLSLSLFLSLSLSLFLYISISLSISLSFSLSLSLSISLPLYVFLSLYHSFDFLS